MKSGLSRDELAQIRAILETVPSVDKAVLFGSRAMGLARTNSDVDIMLYGDGLKMQDIMQISSLLEETTLPYQFDLIHHDAENPALLEHVEQYGKVIFQREKIKNSRCEVKKGVGRLSMRSDWNVCTLDKGIKFKNGKKRPNNSGKYPVYGGNGILGYADDFNDENVVIIGRVGAFCGSVYYEPNKCWISDNAISAQKSTTTDINYIYYLLHSLNLNKRHIGTSQPLLTQEILNRIDVIMPSLPEQRAIAATLSCLDDKIELNNKINANLEAQAQAIFKSWFVDFEPFCDGEFVDSELGMIPEGWRVGLLSELINVKYGKDHKKLTDGHIPVYGSGGVMRYAERALYDKESVLIPRKGTLNNVIYINEPFWTVDTMFYSEVKQPHVAKFVYFFVSSKNLASMNAGSAVPSMTTDILNSIPVIIAPNELYRDYDNLVSPMFEMLSHNQKQSRALAALRDILLPRLMSGELSVTI